MKKRHIALIVAVAIVAFGIIPICAQGDLQRSGEEQDLIVTEIKAYHNNTDCPAWFNLSNEIDVTVKNNGSTPAKASNVSLYIDDEFFGSLPVSSLAAGANETVTFENWKPIGDDCLKTIDNICYFNWSFRDFKNNITAEADCDNEVAETNETNNERSAVLDPKKTRACYNGYMADEPLENVAHGTLHGALLFTTGDGVYSCLYSVGDTQVTNYDITLPETATVILADLNVYYKMTEPFEACPEMEVSIENRTGTYILPLERAYNDMNCTCPGASRVSAWGNYVYNLTGYITGSGTYTVTVKNKCTEKCKYFCTAAPGIALVYEDENAPLIEYHVNRGADVLLGGRRDPTSVNLCWEECINNATFPASAETDTVANATLGVVSLWGSAERDPGMTNYLFFNDLKLGSGVYQGYNENYVISIDSISMHIGSSNAQVGVNVTNVTAYYLKGRGNVVGQADDGNNMMPANAFLVVEYKMPDLVITNKSEAFEDGNFTVSYTVANVGDGDAGESNTTIFIDGIPKRVDSVTALSAGESSTSTIGPFDCSCGTSHSVLVCADNNNEVDESDETNNCMANEVVCLGKPDLIISEKNETVDPTTGNFTITYKVNNTGSADADASHTTIYINGVPSEFSTPAIPKGESHENSVGPFECLCGATLNVTVCADKYNEVDESDETNNCMENTVTCPVVDMPDLIVIGEDINAYHYDTDTPAWFNILNEIDVTVKNNGSVSAGKSNVGLYIEDVRFGKLSVPSLNPGDNHTVTFTGWKPSGCDCLLPPCVFDWSYRNYSLKGVADCDCDVAESNETNNEATAVERVCYNGYMADEPLENVAHGSFHGHLIFSTGDGSYGGLNSPGAIRTTKYDITLPASATVKLAQLNVYYTWVSPDHACPEMEVSITNAGGTYDVPLGRAYNDIKCICPGAMYVKSWGNYVFDITDYVTESGTYTVTVKNTGPAGHKFKIAAPGLTLVYEDETAPLIEYWVNNGADLLLGGRRGDGGFLSLEECINDATFPASTTSEKVATVTLAVVAPWGDNAADDVLYFNTVELGRGVYNGYSSSYDETIDGITMSVGGSNAQVGVSVRSVTSQYHKGSGNIAGQADDGDNMMPANAFLVVGYADLKPDLEIVDKWERWVNETYYNVSYVILNNGSATAPAGHYTSLFVDGEEIKDKQVPVPLAPGKTYTDTFDTVIPCTNESDTIRICADNSHVVYELDEDNNCLENVWSCEHIEKPDLEVVDKWERWVNETHYNVTYVILNNGSATAPAGHNTSLFVGGKEIERKQVPVPLAPRETYPDTFDTVIACTNESDTIRVCADNDDVVDELDEDNNCLENVWSCIGIGMPTITKSSSPTSVSPGGTVNYTINYYYAVGVNLTNVTITENYPAGVTFISASPAPDVGNNKWIIGTLSANESGEIFITVKVPDRDLTFTESGSVSGEGFVMVSKELSTEQSPYSLKNVVTLSCTELPPVSASAITAVGEVVGTSLDITEHGSGIYSSDEVLNLQTKNKTISLEKTTEAKYMPTSFNFANGFSTTFSSKWMQDICIKNDVTGVAIHKKISSASRIEDDTRSEVDASSIAMAFTSSFFGVTHIGIESEDAKTSEDYIGVFNISWAEEEELKYLFNWDDVPGNDSDKLIRFLVDELDIKWVENATITKSSDDMVITVSTNEKTVELIMAENKEKITVKVGGETIHVLIVKTENDKLKVYDKLVSRPESVSGVGYVMVDEEFSEDQMQVIEHGSGIYSSDEIFDSRGLEKRTRAEYMPTYFSFSDGFSTIYTSKWMQGICTKNKDAGTAIHKKISDASYMEDETIAATSSMDFESYFNGSMHLGVRTSEVNISEDYIGHFYVSQVIKRVKLTSANESNTTSNTSDWLSCPCPGALPRSTPTPDLTCPSDP
ncbi:MAG: CARDB domain-containing protein [Halobacteriota archaeon]